MFKITQGKGFHLTFANGWTVSVQFGPGNYGSNKRDDLGTGMSGSTGAQLLQKFRTSCVGAGKKGAELAEIAAWDKDGNFFTFNNGDTVAGWISVDNALKFMNKIAAL